METKKGRLRATLVHGINKTATENSCPVTNAYLHGEMIDGERATSLLIYALRVTHTVMAGFRDEKYREISGNK